jgi:hypothetical protein
MKTAATFCTSLLLILAMTLPAVAQGQERRPSLRFENESLRSVLDSLMTWYGVSIVYFDDHVQGMRVTAECATCSASDALSTLLEGTGLTWVRMGNQYVLRQRPRTAAALTHAVNGVVLDSVTGAWIAGATALLQRQGEQAGGAAFRWCASNSYGFYSLPEVPPGDYLLSVRAVGYAPQEQRVLIGADPPDRSDFQLRQTEIALQEFTVEGHRTESTPAGGVVRGTFVRSIPSDQTQYLLDGARIYNPSHFGGVLSTFQPDVLNDVEPVINGLSPFYGGRIAGLMDLSLREGTKERLTGSAGAGSLGAHLFFEGPLSDRSTFLISARRAFVEPVIPLLGNSQSSSRSGSYEVIGKANYRPASNSRIFLSCYVGGDTYANEADGGGRHLENLFRWSNTNVQGRWFGISSSSLFLFASAAYSRYDLAMDHTLSGSVGTAPMSAPFSTDYHIEDFSLRAHAENFLSAEHTVRGGVDITEHRISGTISEFSLSNPALQMGGSTFWELAVYAQDQWKINENLMADLGIRATSFMGNFGSLSGVDPRFALVLSLTNDTRLYASMTAINQFVHAFRNTGLFYFYPTVFWYPSDSNTRPTTSFQATTGIEHEWDEDAYLASAEAYYRVTNNYHGFILMPELAQPGELHDALRYGNERAFGGTVSLRKRFGQVSGSLRYTLSWLQDSFAGINGGTSFPSPFDRRHELEIWIAYSPSDDWAVNGLCVLASEPPVITSGPPSTISVYNDPPDVAFIRASAIDPNGSKMPGFQRLELTILRRFAAWGVPCQVSLRMLNAYGLIDPFVWTVNPGSDPRRIWSIELKDLNLFPLYPALGLSVRF